MGRRVPAPGVRPARRLTRCEFGRRGWLSLEGTKELWAVYKG